MLQICNSTVLLIFWISSWQIDLFHVFCFDNAMCLLCLKNYGNTTFYISESFKSLHLQIVKTFILQFLYVMSWICEENCNLFFQHIKIVSDFENLFGGKIFCYQLVYHLRISLARFDHLHQNWSTIINSKVSFVVSDYNSVSFSLSHIFGRSWTDHSGGFIKIWHYWLVGVISSTSHSMIMAAIMVINDEVPVGVPPNLLLWWCRYMEVLLKWKGKYSLEISKIEIT